VISSSNCTKILRTTPIRLMVRSSGLLGLLGYAKWENFAKVIDKARIACKTAGHGVSDHFPDVRKMIQHKPCFEGYRLV